MRYNYCLQWYGKDPNDIEAIGVPIETKEIIDLDILNTFFDIEVYGLKVNKIQICIDGLINNGFQYFNNNTKMYNGDLTIA